MVDKVVKNGKVVTPWGLLETDVAIENGKISGLGAYQKLSNAKETIDAKGNLVIPGGIDPHTHFELEFMGAAVPEKWDQGTAAAAVGGTTTIIDFAFQRKGEPLTNTVQRRLERARKLSAIDFSIHPGPTDFSNLEETKKQMRELAGGGLPSFKIFTIYRSEGWYADDWALLNVLEGARDAKGIICLHAENCLIGEEWGKKLVSEGRIEPKYLAKSKPNIVEAVAIQSAISLSVYVKSPLYIVHMSTREGVELVRAARQQGYPVFSETIQKYLTHTDDAYDRENGEYYEISPPLRKTEDVEALWAGLRDGSVSTIGSDHAPFSREQKKRGKTFLAVPNGGPGAEVRLPVIYYYGATKRGLPLNTFVNVVSTNAAKIFGLYPRKGVIAPGSDADLVVFNPNKEKSLNANELETGTDWSWYEGVTIKGWPEIVMLRGKVIVADGKYLGNPGDGEELHREIDPEVLKMV